ncbi:hypothetical protein RHOER0001_2975 [Rhodococcus erythropolis SK121]|nr:hypothetical protein RHOER0001_2975 [Rhodococcus erythropolis SK121]
MIQNTLNGSAGKHTTIDRFEAALRARSHPPTSLEGTPRDPHRATA